MVMESDSSVRVQQRTWAATAAQVLLGLIVGPVLAYLLYYPLSYLPSVPFRVTFIGVLTVSFACGVGIATAIRSWRAFGVALAMGVVLYAAFMYYLFSFFEDLPP